VTRTDIYQVDRVSKSVYLRGKEGGSIMNALLQSQRDFFLYVPVRCNEREAVQSVNGEVALSLKDSLLASGEDWIEIALAESLVVYAHPYSERGQTDGRK
jgi:hypothetical protein